MLLLRAPLMETDMPPPHRLAAVPLFRLLIAALLCILPSHKLRADALDHLCGTYRREPVENGWHVVIVTRKAPRGETGVNPAGAAPKESRPRPRKAKQGAS